LSGSSAATLARNRIKNSKKLGQLSFERCKSTDGLLNSEHGRGSYLRQVQRGYGLLEAVRNLCGTRDDSREQSCDVFRQIAY